jgi:hypothetical protein
MKPASRGIYRLLPKIKQEEAILCIFKLLWREHEVFEDACKDTGANIG